MRPSWTTTHGEPIAWLLALASSVTMDETCGPAGEPEVLVTVRMMLRHPSSTSLLETIITKTAPTAIDALHEVALDIAEQHAVCECGHARSAHGHGDGPWPCHSPCCSCTAFAWPRRAMAGAA